MKLNLYILMMLKKTNKNHLLQNLHQKHLLHHENIANEGHDSASHIENKISFIGYKFTQSEIQHPLYDPRYGPSDCGYHTNGSIITESCSSSSSSSSDYSQPQINTAMDVTEIESIHSDDAKKDEIIISPPKQALKKAPKPKPKEEDIHIGYNLLPLLIDANEDSVGAL
eukprot:480745_1